MTHPLSGIELTLLPTLRIGSIRIQTSGKQISSLCLFNVTNIVLIGFLQSHLCVGVLLFPVSTILVVLSFNSAPKGFLFCRSCYLITPF
jgi:hypothetical protein